MRSNLRNMIKQKVHFIFIFFWPLLLLGNEAEFFTTKVKQGDNVEQLLARFHLNPNNCNVDLFCKINNVKNKHHIIAERDYKIPVKIVRYNGKSIRSTLGISDIETAKRIEAYNVKILNAGVRKTDFKVSKLLWVPMEELECNANQPITQVSSVTQESLKENTSEKRDSSAEPATAEPVVAETVSAPPTGEVVLKKSGIKQIKVPLFGARYEDVFIEDFTLENQVYYIISGHGGPDPGAICTECDHRLCEDEYAYDVALRLARNLMQHGAIVYVIVQDPNDGIRDDRNLLCDHDEVLHGNKIIPLGQKDRLRQRAETVNILYKRHKKQGVKIQKAIEIHVDSRNKDKRQDVFFYYNKNNPDSKTAAENIQNVFQQKYSQHQKDRGYHGYVEDRGLYMVRSLLPTTVFVELANIRNTEDHKRLVVSTNRQALANWLFEGLRK